MRPTIRAILTAALALSLAGAPHRANAAGKKRILAVMPIDDATRRLRPPVVDALTDALRGRLAQGGRFVVIDKSRQAEALKKLVRAQKRASYRACVDSRCQIPLGQALAAEAILRTRLTRIGSSYHLNAELVDLAKEAVVGGAQAQVPVRPMSTREDRLLTAVAVVSAQLGGHGGVPGTMVDGGDVRPSYPATGYPTGRHPSGARYPSGTSEATERARWQRQQQQTALRRQAARARAIQRTARTTGRASTRRRAGRFKALFYGWTSLGSAALLGGLGAYYLTAKVNAEHDKADSATSPSGIDSAADAASTAKKAGWVFVGWGAAMAALGAVFLIMAPDAPPEAKPAPSTGLDASPTPGGFAVSYSGRF